MVQSCQYCIEMDIILTSEFRNRLIFAFYIPSALISIAAATMIPVLPVYASELTSAYFLIGIILAAISLGRVFGSFPASWMLRNMGIKRTMLTGIAITLTPMIFLFFVRNLWLTIAFLFIVGIGLAIYSISRHAYITVVIPLEIRGRSIGLLGGVFRMGNFIGPLIGGWVATQFDMPSAFLAFVTIASISFFFIWYFMRQVDADAYTDEKTKPESGSYRQMLRDNQKIITSAGFGQIFAQLTRQGWRVLIPLYGANVLQLDVGTIGMIVAIGGALDMLFFYASGIIMDRFGRKWAIVPSFTLQAVGIMLILLTSNSFTLSLVAALIGFANGLSSGTMMTIGSDLAPNTMRGEFLSTWNFIGDMGGVSGPIIVGSIAQVLVIQVSVLSIASAGLGAALLFAIFVPETLKGRKPKLQ